MGLQARAPALARNTSLGRHLPKEDLKTTDFEQPRMGNLPTSHLKENEKTVVRRGRGKNR